jgi:hypothetical protein
VAALTVRAENAENSSANLQAQLEELQRAFAEQQSEAAEAKEYARQAIHDLELRCRAFESALMAEKARVDEVRNATTLLEAAHDAERLHWTTLFAKQHELTSISDERLSVAEARRIAAEVEMKQLESRLSDVSEKLSNSSRERREAEAALQEALSKERVARARVEATLAAERENRRAQD